VPATGEHLTSSVTDSLTRQIPGVLVMIYTLRLFSDEDRDIVVLVGSGVSKPYIEQLMASCVLVKKVSEPMDPATHMGFNKLNLWLAIEYSKVRPERMCERREDPDVFARVR
jgi:hypothetical protein